MSLPSLPYSKGVLYPVVRTVFGGLNHNPGAKDGELYDMRNLSAREYPLLSTRARRSLSATFTAPGGIGAGDAPFWVDGISFLYDGTAVGTVSAGEKVFALMGDRVLIFPDKKYYDAASGTFGSLEASRSGSMSFQNGTYTGVPAQANTIYLSGASWGTDFRAGDAVTIAGCAVHPENNGSYIIREVEGDYLRFYDNSFTLDRSWSYTVGPDGLEAGQYHFTPSDTALQFTLPDMNEGDALHWDGAAMTATVGGVTSSVTVTEGSGGEELVFGSVWVDYTETGTVTVSRDVPDLDFVCVNENRLWGCAGDIIYASKLGDPFNFNVFDGLSTDSWQSGNVDAGDFTACVSYLGYPIFFKEDMVYKVYGDRPDNFQWTASARLGVQPGSAKSLAVAGETLYYLSRAGICAYTGGIPAVISAPLGMNTRFDSAAAGSDGLRYYVSMHSADGWGLYVYDTQARTWHREDESEAMGFVFVYGGLYMLLRTGGLWRMDGQDGTEEAAFAWMAQFADSTRFYETSDSGSQNKKGLLRVLLRCEMEEGASLAVHVRYDGGAWEEKRTITATEKMSYHVPLILRRCDHYTLKLTGIGGATVYSVTEEKYGGSWKQTK
ncbi:MAG: hypothetical protein IKO91_05265 [Oscillospiraceae bacterium]|nr:hypothetical protein [Oscillospiraceae bacterium]